MRIPKGEHYGLAGERGCPHETLAHGPATPLLGVCPEEMTLLC